MDKEITLNLEDISGQYVRNILSEIRNNPPVRVGMLVAVYTDMDRTNLFGYARVTGMEWCEPECTYFTSILMTSRREYHGVHMDKLERASFRRSQEACFIKLVVDNNKWLRG